MTENIETKDPVKELKTRKPRKNKVIGRQAFKVNAKQRIIEIGEKLAPKLFPFSGATIDDVIERLFMLEGFKYNLLKEDESRQVHAFFSGNYANNYVAKTEIKPTEINVSAPLEKIQPNSLLPLGNMELSRQY